jgi:nucleoside-diphosphate-sugar epimerase
LARCLIIGCGCRGRELAASLIGSGHVVRGTTRRVECRAEIEAVGAEAVVADPDRIATIAPAFDHVSVACVLLAAATGSSEELRALHGPRLEMLLARMLDTTVRGLVYEVPHGEPGRPAAAIVRAACGRSLIPYVLLEIDPSDHAAWLAAATAAVDRVL